MTGAVEYPDNGWTKVGEGDVWAQWFGEKLAVGSFTRGMPHQVVWLSPAAATALAEFLCGVSR